MKYQIVQMWDSCSLKRHFFHTPYTCSLKRERTPQLVRRVYDFMQILDSFHKHGENWIEISPCLSRKFIMHSWLCYIRLTCILQPTRFRSSTALTMALTSIIINKRTCLVNPSLAGRVLLLLFRGVEKIGCGIVCWNCTAKKVFIVCLNAAQILSCF